MPEYEVLRSTHRRDDGSVAEVGDTVEMDADRRARLPDEKFERLDEPEDDGSDEEPDELDETPEASTDIPEDWDLLRSMAIVVADDYDEPINGQSQRDEIEAVLEDYEPEERAQIRQRAEARLED